MAANHPLHAGPEDVLPDDVLPHDVRLGEVLPRDAPGGVSNTTPPPARTGALPPSAASAAPVDPCRQRHQAILDSAVDFAIIATDAQGRVTEWNHAAEHVLGWPAAEMVGQPIERIFSDADRDSGWAQVEMRTALDTGRAVDERWTARRDGSLFWASGEMTALRGPDGEPSGFLKILRDRTGQRREGEALRRSQDLNTLILDSITDSIVLLELDGAISYASIGAIAALEAGDASALLRLTWQVLWEGGALEPARAALATACAGGTGRFQGSCPTLAGTQKWWDVAISPLPGSDGAPARLLAISRDISELKQAESRQAALLALGDRLRALESLDEMAYAAAETMGRTLGIARAGYGSIDAVRETITIACDWNVPGSASLAGTLRFADFGSYFADLSRGHTVVCSDIADDPRATGSAAYAAIDTRAFLNLPVFEQGRLVAVLYLTHPVPRAWTGHEIGFLRGVADRTRAAIERRRAERDLRELATSLERQVADRTADRDRLWQLSTDLMLVARLDGTILAVNPAWTATLGWAAHELLGGSVFDFMHPDDVAPGVRIVGDISRGEAVRRIDNRYRHIDGSYRWIAWTAVPGDDMINAVGRDITAERERAEALSAAEEALRQAQKMEAVGQLTGGIAHDFNNLLAGITGSLELMQTRLAQGRTAELARYIDAAQGAATRAAALTHRLLAFSRRQTLDPRPADLNTLVAGMEELIRRTVGPAIAVAVSPGPALWTTLADTNQLENALLNLCINARDAMPDGGRLDISTANTTLDARSARDVPPGEYVRLSVTDTGIGMDQEVVRRAFDPFFTTKPAGQGTGLGLSMIYGFVQQSGGEVHLRSEPGRGTTMCLLLPRHHGARDPAPPAATTRRAPRARSGETVLVVDDEPTVRMLVGEVLEELGYTAIEAADGPGGLEAVHAARRIDLLVTDLGLPGGLDGRQLAEAARIARPGLRVLFITGYAESAALGDTPPEAWMHVLTKPFAMEVLASRIRDLITRP